ncbi:hypothetical protein B0H14DRAFT_2874911 [Mycena olivaceomarginata]|nr:hypothetical protein B0H14DRAFT_2874911 [Mycena olivaceomarginata]
MPPSLSSSTLCCCYRSCSPACLLCCCSIPHIPRCRTADLIIFDELQKPSHTVVHLPLSTDMCTASRFPPDLHVLHDPFIIFSISTIEEVVIYLDCPAAHPTDLTVAAVLLFPCDCPSSTRMTILTSDSTLLPVIFRAHTAGSSVRPMTIKVLTEDNTFTPRSHALYSDTASSWDGWEPSSSSLQLPTSFPVHVARSRALALCGLLDSVGANLIFAPSAHAPALHCCALAFQLLFGHVGATLFTGALRHITTSAAAIQHWIWPLPG